MKLKEDTKKRWKSEDMNEPSRKFIETIIVRAGKTTLRYFGKKNFAYSKNTENDVVTYADLASNKIIVESIKNNFPSHGIISEEEKEYQIDSKYIWIIDPVDGTRNFSKGITTYCVMIALTKNNVAIKAAIYRPYTGELYYAERDKGLYKNGKRVYCSKKDYYRNSCGIFGASGQAKFKKVVTSVVNGTHTHNAWIQDFGSIGVNAAYTASGKFDWFIVPASWNSIWDFVAPALILKESGCKVTGFDGKEWQINKDLSILAANPRIHKTIMNIIR